MLTELAQLVLDTQDTNTTEEWLASRPAPVRSTYMVPGKARHTQIPVVLHLLTMVGYPDVAGMTADLTDGFDMLGELRRGPGWKPRTDGRYANPASLDTLASVNWNYVRDRTSRPKTGEYTEKLLAELVEETRLGRVVGPTRPPAGWNIATVPLIDLVTGADRLVPPPPGRHFGGVVPHHPGGRERCHQGQERRRLASGRPQRHGESTRRADAPLCRRLRRHYPSGRRAGRPGTGGGAAHLRPRPPQRLQAVARQGAGALWHILAGAQRGHHVVPHGDVFRRGGVGLEL